MGPVYKSEMQIKMTYKLISDLKCNHKIRGCDCLQKLTEIGMDLGKVSHFQEEKSHNTTTCQVCWIQTQVTTQIRT